MVMRSIRPVCAALALLGCGFLGGAQASDLILVNGHLYTEDPAHPWAEALSVAAGHIEAVGTSPEILTHRSSGTRVIDLKGHTVLPGIVDGHVHTLFGSMALQGLKLSTPEESLWPDEDGTRIVARLKDYAAAHPADRILFARGNFETAGPAMPAHALLDQAVPDRPVVVHNVHEHALWVNARALALAGITAHPVADPTEERFIVRDASGQPTGVLLEASMELMERAILRTLPKDEKLALIRAGTAYLNSFGITSVVNATGNLEEIRLYGELRDRHELTVRTRTAFGAVAVPHALTPAFLKDLEEARTRYHDEWVAANLVKFFADGDTAGDEHVYDPAQYRRQVLELDRRGYQIMTHALRADNAHMILDVYQGLPAANGVRDRRLRIEHADQLEEGDIGRFATLGVIPSMQPAFCCSALPPGVSLPAGMHPWDRWHSLLETHAAVAFSSDWPCTWPPNPFVSIQEAVTRAAWQGRSYGAGQSGRRLTPEVYLPAERITVEQAVEAYTRAGAYAAFRDSQVGSLEVGKLADLAVLSQDIFTVPPDTIGRTQVLLTLVGGQVVSGSLSSLR